MAGHFLSDRTLSSAALVDYLATSALLLLSQRRLFQRDISIESSLSQAGFYSAEHILCVPASCPHVSLRWQSHVGPVF